MCDVKLIKLNQWLIKMRLSGNTNYILVLHAWYNSRYLIHQMTYVFHASRMTNNVMWKLWILLFKNKLCYWKQKDQNIIQNQNKIHLNLIIANHVQIIIIVRNNYRNKIIFYDSHSLIVILKCNENKSYKTFIVDKYSINLRNISLNGIN